jgi:hypothetical protein
MVAGEPGADRELKLPERDRPKPERGAAKPA